MTARGGSRALLAVALTGVAIAFAGCWDEGVVGYTRPLRCNDAECASGEHCGDAGVCEPQPQAIEPSCERVDGQCPECEGDDDCEEGQCEDGTCKPDDEGKDVGEMDDEREADNSGSDNAGSGSDDDP